MKQIEQASSSESADGFARWVDPQSGEEFVLVPAEQFSKLQAIVEGITRRTGWDDPTLNAYEQYRKSK